ncbi:hypothetical protein UFOVP791_8 [uncultured Caudovirales phage]|uniref:Uncharacterized protein n=1 Tax=uncultured Caudovirales phage TaxID=2100421 RepID=A0A6J5NPX2_9CAUD|nr:hypothetical protein UFOVP791_8 [uncultured Caudovirales phage]
MPVVKIDLAAEFTGKKEFSKAEKATAGLSRSVKQLGAAFGLTFGARALANYGKGAVKAFAADEKAARSLALQLKNTGNAFAAPQVEGFIANLQKTTGILDDDLRPAFRTLLTATGDVAKSQKALNLALDISAGTGKDLSAVSMALAKGFGGQTTALSRLGAGLDKATLASGDMDKITSILTAKFQGQAKEAVKGYAGQMALLTVATQNSKEIIGEGLLDALSSIGKDNSVATLGSQMENVATQTANVVRGIGVLIAKLKSIPGVSALTDLVTSTSLGGQAIGALGKLGAQSKTQKGYGSSNTLENFVAAGGVIKKNTIAIKENTKTVIAKTQLDKLAAKFDVERIGLYAALAKATTEEEKARILAKIAIVESNEAAATALNKLSFAAKSATDAFTRYAENATIIIGQGKYAIQGPAGLVPNQMSNAAPMPATNMPVNPSGSNEITIGQGQYAIQAPSGFTTPVINVQVQVAGEDVAAVISSQQEVQSQSGGSGGSWRSVRVM